MLVGLVFGALFIWIESRAKDPIVPLSLFRVRNFTISVMAMFLTAFGFFGAVIYLPQWFQTVGSASATESGYNILPLLFGLIFSAIGAGQLVARTGKYKLLMLGSLILLAIGLFLLTNLRADTDRLTLWFWMLLTGLGIGPSFAVFTLVVQNSVVPRMIGVATSSLTFFQQIGGTIGLTLAGTFLASRFMTELPAGLIGAGVPPEQIGGILGAPGVDLLGTGDLSQRILASVAPEVRTLIEPIIGNVVFAIHQAFSIALSSSFWVGIVGAVIAVAAVTLLHEEPMRTTFEIDG